MKLLRATRQAMIARLEAQEARREALEALRAKRVLGRVSESVVNNWKAAQAARRGA